MCVTEKRPLLRTIVFNLDTENNSTYVFKPTARYLFLGIDAPEVSTQFCEAVSKANRTPYENACYKYFNGEFNFDNAKINEPEPRILQYLNQLKNVISPGMPVLLSITILQFD